MSQDTDRLPRRSYALIRQLDRDVPRPGLPATAREWSRFDEAARLSLAFQTGYRAMVDQLVGTMNAEIQEQEGGEQQSQGPDDRSILHTRLLGADGSVRDVLVNGFDGGLDA